MCAYVVPCSNRTSPRHGSAAVLTRCCFSFRGSIPQFPQAMAPCSELLLGPLQTPPLVYYKAPEFSTWLSIVIVSNEMSDAADAVAAMDAIYGLTWSDQFMEERRCDGSFDRNLREFFIKNHKTSQSGISYKFGTCCQHLCRHQKEKVKETQH